MRTLIGSFVLCCALPVAAQRIPTIRIAPADEVHSHEFTSITSVRELRDGRVYVTDGREQRVLLLDYRTDAAREVGRAGRGPREYSMVAFIHALRGDSSLMADVMARRWVLFHADSIVGTLPPDHPAVVSSQGYFTAVDSLGFVARRIDPPIRDGITTRTERDSGAVVVISRATGLVDTVAKLRGTPRQLTQRTNAEGRVISSSSAFAQRMPSEEAFVLFADGALAVARLDPFRVDWRLPDGRWIRGDSLPIPRIRVDARERQAFESRNAGASQALPPGFPQPPVADFPDFVPPFPLGQGVMAGPRGLLLVRRTKSADFPDMTYLLIDRRGRIVGTFTLSSRERVEGASDRYLYISERDEDDILRLRRHPWR